MISIINLQSNNQTTYTNTYSMPFTWHVKSYDLFLLKMHHSIFVKYFQNMTSAGGFIYTEIIYPSGLTGVLISIKD